MRKLIYLLLLLSLCSCYEDDSIKDYTRLRIVANTDNQQDILNKVKIKNLLKEGFDKDILHYNDLSSDAISLYLYDRISCDLYQSLTIKDDYCYYETKYYEGDIIPSGNYYTHLIIIGKGEGHNFWTILYPEYYGIEFDENNEIEYRSYFVDLFKKRSKK